MAVELLEIPDRDGLDSIRVYFDNREPGKGYLTITCYGCAWNSWWGAMGTQTLQQFFADCDNGYLVTRMSASEHLKMTKARLAYFSRIIDAVQVALAMTTPAKTIEVRSCNLHANCANAPIGSIHCRVEDCEDCFGC